MAKLIGTSPNQVPSNADLGTAAFMDKKDFLLARGSNLSEINKVIPDTALDVFVYDTSKDSDGGAWRKRTQNLSWYNEPLNTRNRGKRKEFPAVAVIVLEYNTLTIYDGDDPDLPMWMYFDRKHGQSDVTYLGSDNTGNLTSVYALDGKMAVGVTVYGMFLTDFLKDKCTRYNTSVLELSENVARRNLPSSLFNIGTGIIDANINDVAMIAQTNAPTDETTGLPVPTIAVGTSGGISLIKDDGTITDKVATVGSNYTRVYDLTFTENGDVAYYHDRGYNLRNCWVIVDKSRFDADYSSFDHNGGAAFTLVPSQWPYGIGTTSNTTNAYDGIVSLGGDNLALSKTLGLSLFNIVDRNRDQSSSAHITSEYNTGWMHGNTKLATLASTERGKVIGGNLFGGDAATDDTNSSTGWSAYSGGSPSVNTNSTYVYQGSRSIKVFGTGSGAGASYYKTNIGITVGKKYVVSGWINSADGDGVQVYAGPSSGSTTYGQQDNLISASNTWSPFAITFTATTNDLYVLFTEQGGNNSPDFYVDGLRVHLAEEDRGVYDNGVQVFGTLEKTQVATGADIVSYSGFNSTTGLVQPYNSDLDPGTGDYTFMIWFKCDPTNTEQTLFRRFGNPTVTGGTLMRVTGSTSLLSWYTRDTSSTVGVANSPNTVDNGEWRFAVGVRDGNRAKLYLDGVEVADVSTSANSHDPGSTAKVHIGVENTSNEESFANAATACEIALARWSLSAPTAEEVKKIYDDEKHFFKDYAKATLYGTSNAPTALAYDDSTNLLHVGTSSGRSVFQGLQRIDNTTHAVQYNISAVNGMVVED